jgi:hypothetical protein
MKKLALLAVIISLIFPLYVQAQGEYQAELLQPDLSLFPRVSTYLNVHQPDGGFIHGLNTESIMVLEDGKSITPDRLQEIRIGLQISVVINTGPGFSVRNTKGISRYDYLKQYLQTWAEDQKLISTDDLNLFTNSGLNQTHLTNSQAWLTALATFQPDFKKAAPSLNPLGEAIQTAQDDERDQLIHRAIFYITPKPGAELTEAAYSDLVARANDARVSIFIWMLASKSDFNSPESSYLRSLTEKTGGQFFAFSGNEPFPEAQTLLEPLRYLYQLEYISGVKTGGKHNLSIKLNLQDAAVSSSPVAFDINLQPVVPMFIGLPGSIERTAPSNSKTPEQSLSPSSLTVEFLLEYPDNLHRDLTSSRLLVDGIEIAKNTSPPFTQFQWDLRSYTTSAIHKLQIEVTDSLGITNQSNLLPVEIQVTIPQKNSWQTFLDTNGVYLIMAAVFLLGMVSALAVSRLRSNSTSRRVRKGAEVNPISLPDRALASDKHSTANPGLTDWQAILQLVTEDFQTIDEPPIRLTDKPITWGTDQEQVSIWVDDPALNPVHCRVYFGEDHRYHLADNHSQAGTWLNFEEVSAEGKELNHGDILRIGEIVYRYEEDPPQQPRKVTVLPYNYQQ